MEIDRRALFVGAAALPHIGIVSDKRAASGRPLVIHNIGGGTREEDKLTDYPMTGRFRWLIGG